MSRFPILMAPIALFMFTLITLLFTQYREDAFAEFQERKLDLIVNYAVDAATEEVVLSTLDLGLDYGDFEKMKIDPQIALDMFCTIFAKSYDMSPTKENFTHIKSSYLPAFLVATYDGFYIGEQTMVNSSGGYDTIFSIKQPYTYVAQDGQLYSLNLGLDDARLFLGSRIERVDAPIAKVDQRIVINTLISDVMMNTVFEQTDKTLTSTIYIPHEMTSINKTLPVQNVSVLAYVNNVEIGLGQTVETFGIGGSRITHQSFVACYLKDGLKQYCFTEDVLPGTIVTETFESPEYAAREGYYFDADTLN